MRRGRRWIAALSLLVGVLLPVGFAAAQGPAVIEVHRVDEGHFTPRPDGPVFILALGIDGGRPGIDTDRADAIHVVGVNAAAGSATVLNIPRDTYVDIPGHGRSKINDAYTFGGPQLQAEVVRRLTGAPIRFVVTATFHGFPRMVDELGGMAVGVPFSMHDRASGANFPAGIVHMNGTQAMAFARNRHIPDGDIRRSEHQGSLIIAALAKLRADGVGASPARTLKALAVLGRHSHLHGVGLNDLYNLGRLGLSIDPARVRNVTMPSGIGKVGAMDVVFVGGGAGRLFADFTDDAVLQAH
jgi:LCP family protein required for cell wall assembly